MRKNITYNICLLYVQHLVFSGQIIVKHLNMWQELGTLLPYWLVYSKSRKGQAGKAMTSNRHTREK